MIQLKTNRDLVQLLEERSCFSIGVGGDGSWSIQIAKRLIGIEVGALIGRRQKSRTPIVDTGLGCPTRIGDGHVGR